MLEMLKQLERIKAQCEGKDLKTRVEFSMREMIVEAIDNKQVRPKYYRKTISLLEISTAILPDIVIECFINDFIKEWNGE